MAVQYYAVIDANGFPIAFYNDQDSPVIPSGVTPITEDQWIEFITNQGLRKWDAATSSVVVYAPPPPPVPPRTIRGAVLVHVLDKATTISPRDLAYVAGLNAAYETQPSIVRIANLIGMAPDAWFDAALAN